jgi:transcriptional regulator with XRE-family HTH domain
MSTAQLVREVRRGRGFTQRELASRAGITQPALADIERAAHDTRVGALSRLVGAAGYQLFVLPTTAHAAADWADHIYQELRSTRRDEEIAFRALIGLSDDLAAVSEPLRVALCVAPPAPCGDPRYDAGIAAVVEFHLSRSRLPVPNWVRESWRVLREEWVVSPYTDLSEVPPAFRRHGVVLAASELASI